MSGSIRIEKLSTINYEVWCVQMSCHLVHHKLWHTVRVHPSAQPSEADDNHACALILVHVEELHFATIQHRQSASEIWKARSRASQTSEAL
jgi:hypothetical protein